MNRRDHARPERLRSPVPRKSGRSIGPGRPDGPPARPGRFDARHDKMSCPDAPKSREAMLQAALTRRAARFLVSGIEEISWWFDHARLDRRVPVVPTPSGLRNLGADRRCPPVNLAHQNLADLGIPAHPVRAVKAIGSAWERFVSSGEVERIDAASRDRAGLAAEPRAPARPIHGARPRGNQRRGDPGDPHP